MTRQITVFLADWPVTTARVEAALPDDTPVAIVTANRVVACSQAARDHGVRRGLRRREAQGHCPQLVVLPRDESAEARVFEPVVGALEAIAPGVEITRPGLASIGVRGPHPLLRRRDGSCWRRSRAGWPDYRCWAAPTC